MDEIDSYRTTQCPMDPDPQMLPGERIRFWLKQIILSSISILLVVALSLILYIFAKYGHPSMNLYMASLSVVAPSALILFVSISTVSKTIRRKMVWGAFQPCGEELVALRNSYRRSPLWIKIVFPAFIWLAAISTTPVVLRATSSPFWAIWSALVLVWTLAIFVTVVSFSRIEPRWPLAFIAGLFLCATILQGIVSRSYDGFFWAFALVTGLMSVGAAVEAARARSVRFTARPASHDS